MKIVKPNVEIITPIDGKKILEHLEKVGRVCYKSEDKIEDGSAESFVGRIIRSGHEAIIEHYNITVKFVTDRGVTHEIVRHRIASYAQESTRYVNYTKDKFGSEIQVVKPVDLDCMSDVFLQWEKACKTAEEMYFKMIESGCKAQTARAVLPTCTKAEIMVTMNLREWRHFLKLRDSEAAHPDIRILAKMLLQQFKEKIPVVFDDLYSFVGSGIVSGTNLSEGRLTRDLTIDKITDIKLVDKNDLLATTSGNSTINKAIDIKIVDEKDNEVEPLPRLNNTVSSEATNDVVNRPSHYTSGNIEVIDYIEDKKLGFCLGNVVKYVTRAGKKDPAKEVEDLKKANWYLKRRIYELTGEEVV